MESRYLEEKLRQALQAAPTRTDRRHLEATLFLAKEELQQKRQRSRISFGQFLVMQIPFIGWKIWGMQALVLTVLNTLLSRIYGTEPPRYIARLLSCSSVLVLMTALPFLYRSVRYRMQETEAASRFSCVRLLFAKLAMVGLGDLFMLGVLFQTALWKTDLSAEGIFISLCFPFLLAGCGCLFLLEHLPAKSFYVGSIGLCSVLLLLALLFFRYYDGLLFRAFPGRWLTACAFLLVLCICECRHIIRGSAYTERQLT